MGDNQILYTDSLEEFFFTGYTRMRTIFAKL